MFFSVWTVLPYGIRLFGETYQGFYCFGGFLIGCQQGTQHIIAKLILFVDLHRFQIRTQSHREGRETKGKFFVFTCHVKPFGKVRRQFVGSIPFKFFCRFKNNGPVILERKLSGNIRFDTDQFRQPVTLQFILRYILIEYQIHRRIPGYFPRCKGFYIRIKRQLIRLAFATL